MNCLAISELKPELSELASKQIRGIVTLIWPYSSSARQFALLLGDADFRLRRKHGQVRVRFAGSSARAVANTGVGIGDEVVLGLRGVEFVRDGSVSTPGKSIDWELAYTQTLSASIVREGSEIANLDFFDVAPTPAPRSSPRSRRSFESSHQWSSPAFLKRARLSEISPLDSAYDTFADTEHAKKRRRRSYKDWNAWTYVGRTPSPEKEDLDTEVSNSIRGSPIRAIEMLDTPISSVGIETISDEDSTPRVAEEAEHMEFDGQTVTDLYTIETEYHLPSQDDVQTNEPENEFVREPIYDDLHTEPDGQYLGIHRGSLELDTEPNMDQIEASAESKETLHDALPFSGNNEDPRDPYLGRRSPEVIELLTGSDDAQTEAEADAPTTEESTDTEHVALATDEFDEFLIDGSADQSPRQHMDTYDHSISVEEASDVISEITMPPPPTLSLLQTDFRTTYRPGMLTPIGKEPSSPNLQPLDSSTLPMPSPFPGERDGNVSSYLDFVSSPHPSAQQAPVENSDQGLPDDEADYILETSFYSSVSSSRAPAFHPTHESAFTDVRFTFGLDGATLSRPHTSSGVGEAFNVSAIDNSNAGGALFSSPTSANRGWIQSNDTAGDTNSFTTAFPLSREPFLQEITAGDLASFSISGHGQGRHPTQSDAKVGAGEHTTVVSDQDHVIVGEEVIQTNQGAPYQISQNVTGGDHGATGSPEQVEHSSISMPVDTTWDDGTVGQSGQQSSATSKETGANILLDEIIVDSLPQVSARASQPTDVSGDAIEPIVHFSSLVTQSSVAQERSYGNDEVASTQNSSLGSVPPAFIFEEQAYRVNPSQTKYTDSQRAWDTEMVPQSPQETVQMDPNESTSASFIDEEGRQTENKATFGSDFEATPTKKPIVNISHSTPVLDTSPARNTRSKAKTLRRTGSEVSIDAQTLNDVTPLSEVLHETTSPPTIQSTSPVLPTNGSFLASPYNIKSPSKHFSPVPDASEKSFQQLLGQDRSSVEPLTQQDCSPQMSPHTNDLSLLQAKNDSSPVLDISHASQDQFANKSPLKESEEGSMHTVQSSSSVQHPTDISIGLDSHNSMVFERQAEEHVSTPKSTHDPKSEAVSPQTPAQEITPQVKATGEGDHAKAAVLFTTQLPLSSPTRSVRSVASSNVVSNTPRRSRRINKGLSDLAADADMLKSDAHTPSRNSEEVGHPATAMTAGSYDDMQSSPTTDDESIAAAESDARLHTLPHAEKPHTAFANQQSLLPMTPNETQNTLVDSQTYSNAAQDQTLPLTPQLTQSTSATHESFPVGSLTTQKHVTMTEDKSESQHDTVTADVASLSASGRSIHSASDTELAPVKLETPSIGLSTPIAYYTPLKDLPYFLNRSSAFHSAGSPDILALVTTPSTPPTRANKGPKHYTTTLHITDLSMYPSQTTVQVFRAYANALPVAESGDVILLRGMSVKSLNRHPCLISADESAWCVWRYGKPLWGKKRGVYGELKSREEVNGPAVERGEGEWAEVEKIQGWYLDVVKEELEEKVKRTRSKDKQGEGS